MRPRLDARHPLQLLLRREQLQALHHEARAWESEAFGTLPAVLGIPITRGEPGRWLASFSMVALKTEALLARSPRRDGRYLIELSANQADRFYAVLTWRVLMHTAAREPDAPIAIWRRLVTGIRAAADRPVGGMLALVAARDVPRDAVATSPDLQQVDLFGGAA